MDLTGAYRTGGHDGVFGTSYPTKTVISLRMPASIEGLSMMSAALSRSCGSGTTLIRVSAFLRSALVAAEVMSRLMNRCRIAPMLWGSVPAGRLIAAASEDSQFNAYRTLLGSDPWFCGGDGSRDTGGDPFRRNSLLEVISMKVSGGRTKFAPPFSRTA
jgi:hypothetical protein